MFSRLAENVARDVRELLYTALTRQRERIVILHQGDRTELRKFASDYFSETKRRLTNLFVPPELDNARGPIPRGTADSQVESGRTNALEVRGDHRGSARRGWDRLRVRGAARLTDGSTRWPDFTIEDADRGRTVYWEHCGMLGDPEYDNAGSGNSSGTETQGIVSIEEDRTAARALVVTEDDLRAGASTPTRSPS